MSITEQHPAGATEPNWMVLTGETWWNLRCHRANHLCSMLRGVYKPTLGCASLTFGKITVPNTKTCCTPNMPIHSANVQVSSVSSPLLSFQPNRPLLSHPLKCLFFVKASLDRNSHGGLSSPFTLPTNYNQGLSLTFNCCLIVFSLLACLSNFMPGPR